MYFQQDPVVGCLVEQQKRLFDLSQWTLLEIEAKNLNWWTSIAMKAMAALYVLVGSGFSNIVHNEIAGNSDVDHIFCCTFQNPMRSDDFVNSKAANGCFDNGSCLPC